VDGGSGDVEEIVYGAEGTFDLGANTVASLSATTGNVDFLGTDIDNWNVDGSLAFYASPNLRIGGGVGFGNLSVASVDADTISYNIGAEWQPFSHPISFTVGYSHFDVDDVFLGGIDADTLSVGARWNFGGSLRDRDNATPFDVQTGLYQRIYGLR